MSVIFHFKLTIFQRAQRTLRRIATRSIPFDSIRFHSVPFDSVRFHSIPFNSIHEIYRSTRSIPFGSVRFHSVPFDSIRFDSIRYTHLNNRIATTRNRDGDFIVMRDISFIVRCHSAMTTMDDLLLAARLPGWCTESPLFKDDRLAGCEPDTSP